MSPTVHRSLCQHVNVPSSCLIQQESLHTSSMEFAQCRIARRKERFNAKCKDWKIHLASLGCADATRFAPARAVLAKSTVRKRQGGKPEWGTARPCIVSYSVPLVLQNSSSRDRNTHGLRVQIRDLELREGAESHGRCITAVRIWTALDASRAPQGRRLNLRCSTISQEYVNMMG